MHRKIRLFLQYSDGRLSEDDRATADVKTLGSDMLKMDFVDYLPKELSVNILTYLTPRYLSIVSQCSRKWREISNSDALW